ncbi:hypothetical protein [Enterococcus sp. AZ194]|uniref:hypothetical protein n=1 Tax=Enterococcus sp. AZ194 TaxID=2774629 RepID=UPI003F6840A7
MTIIISSFLLLGGMFLLGYRYLVHSRLSQIKDVESFSPAFQRKFAYVKQKETEKHVFYLLLLSTLLVLSLVVGTASTYQLTKASTDSQKEIQLLKKEIEQLKTQTQTRLTDSSTQATIGEGQPNESKEISKTELNLTAYKWQDVFENKKQSEIKNIEFGLANTLKEYFQVDTVKVTLETDKTMHLFLISNPKASKKSQLLGERITEFVKEAKEIPGLNQIRFESDKAIKNDDTSILYSRKLNQDSFREQRDNTSKMKEGKG